MLYFDADVRAIELRWIAVLHLLVIVSVDIKHNLCVCFSSPNVQFLVQIIVFLSFIFDFYKYEERGVLA